MRKLKLDVEHLAVESFDLDATGAARGTAHAHSFVALVADDTAADACLTCEKTCPAGCGGDDGFIQEWPAEPPRTGFGVTCTWDRVCLQ